MKSTYIRRVFSGERLNCPYMFAACRQLLRGVSAFCGLEIFAADIPGVFIEVDAVLASSPSPSAAAYRRSPVPAASGTH